MYKNVNIYISKTRHLFLNELHISVSSKPFKSSKVCKKPRYTR